jgi:hypothetical protein
LISDIDKANIIENLASNLLVSKIDFMTGNRNFTLEFFRGLYDIFRVEYYREHVKITLSDRYSLL